MFDDLVATLQSLNIPYRTSGTHSSSGWLQIDCPFCGLGTGKFHLGINLSFPRANCWKCGKKGLAKTLQLSSFLSYDECKNIVQKLPRAFYQRDLVLPQKVKMPKNIKPMQKCHRDYVRSRGLDPKQMEDLWNLQGFDFDHPDYKFRLFIPIEYRHTVVSYTTRTISRVAKIRYIACPKENEAIPHKSLLYGLDYVRHKAIVVEGPSDVWNVGPGAIASFGIDYSAEQVKALSQIPVRYVCYDKEADHKAEQLIEELNYFDGETHRIYLDAEDPGSACKKEIDQLRKVLE